MTPHDDLLARQLRRARENPPAPPAEPPAFGFATRVAGRWAGARRTPSARSVWERLCLRAAGGMTVAALVVCVVVWQGWTPVEPDQDLQFESQLLELLPVP